MNKYTPLTFFSLLIVPIAFGVAQAQSNSNTSPDVKDPFEIMLNQAREQQRQHLVQSFAEYQKQSQTANAQNNPAMGKGQNINPENQAGQPNSNQPTNSNQPNNANTTNSQGTPAAPTGTPSSPPATPTANPAANIPMPSANPTNTPQSPANIYAAPPTNNPTQPQLPSQQQKPTNMYG